MKILDYIILKDSIKESFKFNKTIFLNNKNNGYIENISNPKFFISFDIVTKKLNEYEIVKKELEDNIDEIVICPIPSTISYIDSDILNENIIVGDFYDPWCKPGDFLLYGETFQLKKVLIIDVLDNGTIVLLNDIDLYNGNIVMIGKQLSLSNDISIDDISNVFKKFNISCEEL